MDLKDIRDIKNLKGKKVLLKSTLNVPINKDGEVINDYRLRKSLDTINFLKKSGAKIIIIGHLGRDKNQTISPVYERLKQYTNLSFMGQLLGKETQTAIDNMNDGDTIILENIRSHEGEITNDDNFAKALASLAEIYIVDDFSVSHREHASVVGLPKYLPSFAGILFLREIKELSKALNPPPPSLCILGGAKFDTKEPLIDKLLNIYDRVFITGALANDFFKINGFKIGKSLVSKNPIDIKSLSSNTKIRIPFDMTVENETGVFVKNPNEVLDGDRIVDAGPETTSQLGHLVNDYKFILWNGPLGAYEEGFVEQTENLAKYLARSLAETVIGGGDTIASIEHLGLEDQFSFISTGGGAMLQFLLNGTTVGIEALENSN